MGSNEIINNLKRQAENEKEEIILLYSLALARLVFKETTVQDKKNPTHNYYAEQGMSDFEKTRILLKALKESLSKIENNEEKQIELFGSKEAYTTFKSQVEVASNAAASLNKASIIGDVSGGVLFLLAAAVITTAFCALCAVMPWFVPVAILAGTVVIPLILSSVSGNQLKKGSNVFNEMQTETSDKKSTKDESTIFDSPAAFFKSGVVGQAITKLGTGEVKKQYEDIERLQEQWSLGSNGGYVDRETRRNQAIASMRAADRAAFGCD